ncbi:MAG: LPS-assembly protein LptD [Sulfurimonas sp.]|nr:LPS-assembly protein LptD [Sulfurimonas sp.]MBU1217186.1 LPS assembly protein LptD [bacterium]MBU1433972.1 LPS assembly protein LptD [bacterium]MBU1502954.1 LPS assembly protein LptD [bacterium]MBU3938266.1 LPS assembly protein LptD [bacterium]
MYKLLFLSFLFVLMLHAEDKVEIYASSIDSKDNIVNASGDVTVIYKDYFLNAKSATYNKATGDLELFDNIRATYDGEYRVLGSYAKLNIEKKEKTFKPFFMLDNSSEVWISANEGVNKDKDVDIDAGVLSGCEPENPLWKMEFSSSDYNTDSQWMNLYNARLYIYDIPILYTPYFGYSLDTRRRTGLLIPSMGLSQSEGFFYEQPLYVAEQDWWDLELRPQVRTQRGSGVYSKFRFVDSEISAGEFRFGYFKEKDAYVEKENLANSSHYGYNFKYENKDVLNQWFGTQFQGQSGLYTDINKMNDVDYINLSSNDTFNTATSTQVLSRINLFYNTSNDYFGAYFKYYEDLTKASNEDTLQQLPVTHYHHYLETLLQDHLLYSVDARATNIEREINKTALQTDVNVPITLYTSLFDEYLDVSYKANLYGQHTKFSSNEEVLLPGVDYNDGYFARYYHVLSASTDLTRAFDDYTHVISFSSKYTLGGNESKTGYYLDQREFCSDPENLDSAECEFYNIKDIDEAVEFNMAQYLYDSLGKEILYHRVAQKFVYGTEETKAGEFENELDYHITDSLSIYNNMFYNFDQHLFSKIFNKASYEGYGFNLSLGHMYRDTFLADNARTLRRTSYLTSMARYTYNRHYSYHTRYDYDLESSQRKSLEFGFLYKKRCWDFGVRYAENNRPVLTNDGQSSIYDRYVYFTIVLKPFMTSTKDFGESNIAMRLNE